MGLLDTLDNSSSKEMRYMPPGVVMAEIECIRNGVNQKGLPYIAFEANIQEVVDEMKPWPEEFDAETYPDLDVGEVVNITRNLQFTSNVDEAYDALAVLVSKHLGCEVTRGDCKEEGEARDTLKKALRNDEFFAGIVVKITSTPRQKKNGTYTTFPDYKFE